MKSQRAMDRASDQDLAMLGLKRSKKFLVELRRIREETIEIEIDAKTESEAELLALTAQDHDKLRWNDDPIDTIECMNVKEADNAER